MKLTVLNYHKVSPDGDQFVPALHPKRFAGQIAWLARWYRVVGLDEGVRLLEHNGRGHRVAITFDDGYDCFETFAWPILKKYGLPAIVFVATGAVDRREPIWTDTVGVICRNLNTEHLNVRWADGERTLAAVTVEQRVAAALEIKKILKTLPDEKRLKCLKHLRAQAGGVRLDGPVPLGTDAIRRLTAEGVGFGAHTVRHPILSRLPASDATLEIRDSRKRLEELCGRPVTAFAYPNGGPDDYTAETVRIVRECGFTCAVTTSGGTNVSGADPFTLRRMYTTYPDTVRFGWHLLKGQGMA